MSLQTSAMVLAFDYGDKRIGVASASLVTKLANPQEVIDNNDKAIAKIKALTGNGRAEAVVVGLPRNASGGLTEQSKKSEAFAAKLRQQLDIPVYMQDESLTSKKAEAELENKGVRYNKGSVDALAATYILEDFLLEHSDLIEQ